MRLCEVYTSIQGEGPNMGEPTTFVRFGGCNLRCPGWGEGVLPDGTVVPGCDTVFAVYPEYRNTWEKVSPEQVYAEIPESPKHVCITGGEPLIQPAKELKLLMLMLLKGGRTVDVFTNGTRALRPHGWWVRNERVTIVADWKLPGSGEAGTFFLDNLELLGEKDVIKFVCKDREDFDQALVDIGLIKHWTEYPQHWFGPVWGELDPSVLAEWLTNEYPVGKLNVQLHKYFWGEERRR